MEVREFAESDWHNFNGCSNWPDGKPPLIGKGILENGKEYMIVFDPTGACLLIEDDDEINIAGGRILSLPLPSQRLARSLARGMGFPATIHQFHMFGFREL